MSQYFLHVPGLLKAKELARIDELVATAQFVDGKLTASGPARKVKRNKQIEGESAELAEIRSILETARRTSPLFSIAALPRRVYPFVVSRYQPGDSYGWHLDNPLMGEPPMRTDLAMTVFLSDPASYQGGELVIQDGPHQAAFKPARGDAVLYPCQYLHAVNPVSQGARLAAVTWIQSEVKSAEQRALLFQLNQVHGMLSQRSPGTPETTMLLQAHSNLYRMWAEL
jgi:PKHD-type hydroxylase